MSNDDECLKIILVRARMFMCLYACLFVCVIGYCAEHEEKTLQFPGPEKN